MKSSSLFPTPRPRTSRPPESRSIVAVCLANAGKLERIGVTRTPVTRRTSVVTTAAAAEHRQWVEVRINESVDDADTCEATSLRVHGPSEHRRGLHSRNRRRQTETDIHEEISSGYEQAVTPTTRELRRADDDARLW